jgi:hypothetical protein
MCMTRCFAGIKECITHTLPNFIIFLRWVEYNITIKYSEIENFTLVGNLLIPTSYQYNYVKYQENVYTWYPANIYLKLSYPEHTLSVGKWQ